MNKPLESTEVKHIHRNKPQLEVMLVMPRTLVSLWGRGTGKTMGLTSYMAYNAVTQMPGSVGAIGCDSYTHLKREILPELFKVWKRDFGLKKDQDFWVNEFPPKELGIPEAIRPVLDKENMIFFRNGSAIKLFSFNFAALQNGDSIDWMIIEEAKLVKPERVNEALPCLRGNEDVFGHLSCHKSLTLISDMPDHVKGMWLLDYEKKVDEERIEVIFQIQKHLFILQSELDGGVTEKRAAEIQFQISYLNEKLNDIRRNTVFVSYASTLDNVHSVGIDAILNLKRILSPERYRLSVLNWHPHKMEACYYAMLSEGRHGYVALSELAERAGAGPGDCRWDTDIDFNQALSISLDYNAKFSCMVVGQVQHRKRGPVLRFLKDFHVKHPKRIRDLIRQFDKYYKHLPNRVVNFYYDHTAKPGNAKDTETYKDVVIEELELLGWKVYDYQFKSTTHHKRYEDWANLFEQASEDIPFSFEYNMENCRNWANACQYTEVEIKHYTEDGVVKTRIKKVKKTETDGKTDPLDAPHLTEAGDGLFVAILQEMTSYRGIGMRIG